MNVFIIAAITADGFIARNATHAADWTSSEDKKLFVELTKQAGVMVMGSRTFATIGRALPGRQTIVYTSQPDQVGPDTVTFTNEPPAALVKRLEQGGHTDLAICGGESIYSLFLKSGVVNELFLTIEPKLFGTGVPLFNYEADHDLTLIETKLLNDNTVLLHYRLEP